MKYIAPIGAADPDDPYIDGNPGLGVQGSAVPAAAIEHAMREIVYVITTAGLTPNEAVLTQLHQAIAAMIAANVAPDASTIVKGILELATNSEALDGSDSTRAVTSAALASAKSYAANGYQKFPGGLIIQWGESSSTTVTFPITFPTACRSVCVTDSDVTPNVISVTAVTTSGYTQGGDNSGFFIAIGY